MSHTLPRFRGIIRAFQAAATLYVWYDHTQHVQLQLTDDRTGSIMEREVAPELRRLIVSDLHIGAGDLLDDFTADAELAAFIEQYAADRPTELILAGDTFEFLQVRLPDIGDNEWSETAAVRRLEAILTAHRQPVDALRRFVRHPGNQLTLLIGNHDFELHYRAAKQLLRTALGLDDADPRLRFAIQYQGGGIYLEHGNQFEPWNSFVHFEGISAPFEYIHGSRFVKDVINSIETENLPYATLVDNVLPPMRFVHHLARSGSPNAYRILVRGLLLAARCALQTPIYESAASTTHPVRRFVERTRRRFAGRFARHIGEPIGLRACVEPGTFDGIVMQAMSRIARRPVHRHRRLFVCGHTHVARIAALNDEQTYINTGTWTEIVHNLEQHHRHQEHRYPFVEITYERGSNEPGATLFDWIGHGQPPRPWRKHV